MFNFKRHAPRERVSWNMSIALSEKTTSLVTLHVSVWVEMKPCLELFACAEVTLHVSVWVEMNWKFLCKRRARSRSTWACELKCFKYIIWQSELKVTLHVSVWVEILFAFFIFSPFLSRSTWACELKYFSNNYIVTGIVSRSTWACELKWQRKSLQRKNLQVTLHVSVWVEMSSIASKVISHFVTLHVSVWVEIEKWQSSNSVSMQSRSTWACELKCKNRAHRTYLQSHAPRERVSWNLFNSCTIFSSPVTLHVSVWVEI